MLSRHSGAITYIDPSDPTHYNNNNFVQFDMAKNFIDVNAQYIRSPVLDIGCRDGKISAYIADNIAHPVTGVDISSDRVRYANQHYAHRQLHFFQGDATELRKCRPVNRNKYNTLVSFNALHHLPRELQLSVFYSAHKMLHKDGILLCLIPGRSPALHDAIQEAVNLMRWQIFFMDFALDSVRTYETPEHYKLLSLKAGFVDCDVTTVTLNSGLDLNPAEFIDFLRGFLPHIAHLKSKKVNQALQDRFLEDVAGIYFARCGKLAHETVSPDITQIKLTAYAGHGSFFYTLPKSIRETLEGTEENQLRARL